MEKSNGKQKQSTQKSFFSSVKDERIKVVISLFLLITGFFLTLAFISYFFTWKSDQSFIWQDVFSSADLIVDNWAGKLGAQVAHFFIYNLFGLSSIAIPFLLVILSLHLVNIKVLPLLKTIRITILATILLSVISGYLFGTLNGYLGSGPGGSHGLFVSRWLNALLGKTGNAFFLSLVTFTFIIFSFPSVYDWLKKIFSAQAGKDESTELNEEQTIETTYPDDTDLVFVTNKVDGDATVNQNENENQNENQHEDEEDEESEDEGVEEEEDVELEVEQAEEEQTSILEPQGDYDPTLDLSSFKMPPIDLLEKHEINNLEVGDEELIRNKNRIVETLKNYKIDITKITATIGPTVTLYEIIPAPGIRISKIKNLEDDIALSLAALGIRIIAPIPGKGTIGIEVPNQQPQIVSGRSVIGSRKFQEAKGDLNIAIGKTVSNETYIFDLARAPHLLVAGATGQGKSVGLNCIITSLLYKKHPAELKFVFVDPKKVELTPYIKIARHYLAQLPGTDSPIITDTQKVVHTLKSLCIEMDNRYGLLEKAGVRNIREYNARFISRKLLPTPPHNHRFLPFIVVVIDEFADLIQQAGKEVEIPLARLAQLARAIGIHLVIATQRPSTDVITGLIKANFPSRIAFRVSSMIDSRTIIDKPGANQLIGRGDLLITEGSDLKRIQCAFIDTAEIEKICDFIGNQNGFEHPYYLPEYIEENKNEPGEEMEGNKRDDLFDDAARLIVQHQQGSTSLLQRKFSIGYTRAGRIMDQLENAKIVGPFEGSKARKVLYTDLMALDQYLNSLQKEDQGGF